ncbi:MAG: deoxyribonuclease IV [Patescibacteria group bacterium]|jgi:deoxyribonuclease-4
MRLGAHVSAAGGLWKAGIYGEELGCEVIQIFTRPPQSFSVKPITDEDAEKFKTSMKEHKIQDVYIHAPYLVNLASGNNRVYHGSISMIRGELERGTQLGAKAVMFHPGSAKDVGRGKGIEMVSKALDKMLEGYEGSTQLLIEISAGAGEIMGDSFEEITAFIDGSKYGKDIGVCFDTQHAFASGYDLRTAKDVEKTFKLFDKTIGLKKLVASHCNDSKVEFEAHKDRHEHLGKGSMGVEAFKAIVQSKLLKHVDLILETPYEGGGGNDPERVEDMKLLKGFRK